MGLRIAVLYNDDAALLHGDAGDALAVAAVVPCARAVTQALQARGHRAEMIGLKPDLPTLARTLAGLDVELVFNLVEALGGDARLEAAMAWLYELARLRYTGSPPEAMTLGLDKPLCKAVLRDRGIAVAPGVLVVNGNEPFGDLRYPAIVKPAHEDASHGITVDSVVANEAMARTRARDVVARYRQPALVESFLPGREFNVAVLGAGADAHCLELAEIAFDELPASHPPLVTYEAKWAEDSEAFLKTPSIAARALAPALAAAIRRTALDAYRAVGLRDYGRVDLRLDHDGQPCVLEVNPNPDISPDAGLARAAERSGIPYDELIDRIVRDTAQRA
ncbi:MAG: D-alanine--D-alanine ligase [Pseudomonadota bacterium]